jgi:nucleoid DNA-binding protein
MTKHDLALQVQCDTDVTLTAAEKAVNIVIKSIISAVKAGERVELRDFGTFSPVTRQGGVRRNPRTGEEVITGPRKSCKFRPGKGFKDVLNG